ncbi:MAG: hypothetical protein IKN81_07070 [Oscillospiraceae bacterium]|nr:hypothetical protein [Oscillospiraceae bacterium]
MPIFSARRRNLRAARSGSRSRRSSSKSVRAQKSHSGRSSGESTPKNSPAPAAAAKIVYSRSSPPVRRRANSSADSASAAQNSASITPVSGRFPRRRSRTARSRS